MTAEKEKTEGGQIGNSPRLNIFRIDRQGATQASGRRPFTEKNVRRLSYNPSVITATVAPQIMTLHSSFDSRTQSSHNRLSKPVNDIDQDDNNKEDENLFPTGEPYSFSAHQQFNCRRHHKPRQADATRRGLQTTLIASLLHNSNNKHMRSGVFTSNQSVQSTAMTTKKTLPQRRPLRRPAATFSNWPLHCHSAPRTQARRHSPERFGAE